jgi:hypothetical protein
MVLLKVLLVLLKVLLVLLKVLLVLLKVLPQSGDFSCFYFLLSNAITKVRLGIFIKFLNLLSKLGHLVLIHISL